MTSPLLALFIRSLREDSRQKLTYFARSGLVARHPALPVLHPAGHGLDERPGAEIFRNRRRDRLCVRHPRRGQLFLLRDQRGKGGDDPRPAAHDQSQSALDPAREIDQPAVHRGPAFRRAGSIYAARHHARRDLAAPGLRRLLSRSAAFLVFVFQSRAAGLGALPPHRQCAAVSPASRSSFFSPWFRCAIWFAQLAGQVGMLKHGNAWVDCARLRSARCLAASPFTRFGTIIATGFREPHFLSGLEQSR